MKRPVDLERIKLRVEIIGLILIFGTLVCYCCLAYLQRKSNNLTANLVTNAKKNFELSKRNVEDTEKSIAISASSVELTKESLKDAQDVVRMAHTPWLAVGSRIITDDSNSKTLVIELSIENTSDTPALKVNVKELKTNVKISTLQSALDNNQPGYADENGMEWKVMVFGSGRSHFSSIIMPHATELHTYTYKSAILPDFTPSDVYSLIKRGYIFPTFSLTYDDLNGHHYRLGIMQECDAQRMETVSEIFDPDFQPKK